MPPAFESVPDMLKPPNGWAPTFTVATRVSVAVSTSEVPDGATLYELDVEGEPVKIGVVAVGAVS